MSAMCMCVSRMVVGFVLPSNVLVVSNVCVCTW
jgi:hypothetical protein